MKKAVAPIAKNTEYLSIKVAEVEETMVVYKPDILMIYAKEKGSKHKTICIKDKKQEYTLMRGSFLKLLTCINLLVQVNRFTLVSVKAVQSHRYDDITLKDIFPGWNGKQITLNRKFRKNFYLRVGELGIQKIG